MPGGKDSIQALPGYERLRMTDHMRAMTKGTQAETDAKTGEVTPNPRRKFLEERIRAYEEEERMERASRK